MSAGDDEYQQWRDQGGVFDLSARTKLRLTGADRVRYLNGQVTANITTLKPGGTLPACVTTAKGKLSAVVTISAAEDALYVDAEPELCEGLLARLERYIVADDVVLDDVTDEYLLWHFLGPAAAGESFAAAAPAGLVRRASRYGALGWDALLPKPPGDAPAASIQQTSFFETNLSAALLISPALAETIRLEAGLPRWGYELGEETLPPEAGLDRTHIDYAKGCYIGQEVISRIKSVGHVNRQLHTFVSVTGDELQSGWSLFAPEEPGRSLGQLTSTAWSFALAKPVALGYLRRGSPSGTLLARPGDLSAGGVEVAPRSEPIALPFS